MAFLDFLTGRMRCPSCGTSGASKTEVGYRCKNPSCQWFDAAFAPSGPPAKREVRGGRNPQTGEPIPAPAKTGIEFRRAQGEAGMEGLAQGGFAPARTIGISYRNFKGELKTFVADPETAVRKNNHLSVRVAPTGARIVLSRDRIQNLREAENALPQRVAPGQAWPTPRESRVLGYHKRYKTTSPLYEKIRAKYPNW